MCDMSVEDRTPEVAYMVDQSQPIRDLTAGGNTMRAMGETYLPKFPMETTEAYEARKKSSWLFDGVGKALEDYVDRVFDKPWTSQDEGDIGEWCENIDMAGLTLSAFSQAVFEAGVKDGISFVMADAPQRPDEPLNRAQVAAANIRPYLSHIELSEVIGWRVEAVNNEPTLVHFRFLESIPKPDRDEFSNEMVDQIRSLDLIDGSVSVRLYQEVRKDIWEIVDEYATQSEEIMVAPFYTRRKGFMMAKPPLARLAEINLAHWRSQSDQSNIMHYARVPLKLFMGWDADQLSEAIAGAGYAFVTNNPDAKAQTLEHSGAALSAGRDELKDLEQQMQWQGLQLVMSRSSGATATGDIMDEKKNTSALGRWAENLADTITRGLEWVADLGGVQNADFGIERSMDYLAVSADDVGMDALMKMGVSTETLLREAKRRGGLSADLSVEDELERMATDPAAMGAMPDDMAGESDDNVVDFFQGIAEGLQVG